MIIMSGIQNRRQFLQSALTTGLILPCLSQAFAYQAAVLERGRLIVVFLRGAYDGLSAFVPYADPYYAELRRSTRIPDPDGSAQTTIKLDPTFGLHPALTPLLPMWHDGSFTFLPACGLPVAIRSHFEAQHQCEIGIPGKNSENSGWLNRLAALEVGRRRDQRLIGVGEANPRILAGQANARLIPAGRSAMQTGLMANERSREALLALYSGDDILSQAFRQGADSRLRTAQELNLESGTISREMMAANNGAGDIGGLTLDAQHLGTLMRADPHLRLGFLSAGGWDTHASQGGVQGQLANRLGNLSRALVQLRQNFNAPGDLILVMSEFGRTCAENGSGGTDHGHGNALWIIGNAVQGGRWHGRWSGLAPEQLHQQRDLPVHHDFRSVLAQILAQHFNLSESQLDQIFPGAKWDHSLNGLIRPV
jgi:uncharacterized protein (DUF1501 family)